MAYVIVNSEWEVLEKDPVAGEVKVAEERVTEFIYHKDLPASEIIDLYLISEYNENYPYLKPFLSEKLQMRMSVMPEMDRNIRRLSDITLEQLADLLYYIGPLTWWLMVKMLNISSMWWMHENRDTFGRA